MRKKILFLSFFLFCTFVLPTQDVFALTVLEVADSAIAKTKKQTNYWTYSIPTDKGTTTIWFLPYEKEDYESEFKLTVKRIYDSTVVWNVSFSTKLDEKNQERISIYQNLTGGAKERAKNALLISIYENFTLFWNNQAIIDNNDNVDSKRKIILYSKITQQLISIQKN